MWKQVFIFLSGIATKPFSSPEFSLDNSDCIHYQPDFVSNNAQFTVDPFSHVCPSRSDHHWLVEERRDESP